MLLGFLIWVLACPLPILAAEMLSTPHEEELVSNICHFLSVWLLNKDQAKAAKYLATTPLLSTCLNLKTSNSPKPSRLPKEGTRILSELLDTVRANVVPSRELTGVVTNPRLVSSQDSNVTVIKHSLNSRFQIFKLDQTKHPEDLGYICKFDEDAEFRKAVGRPDIYYMVVEITVIRGPAVRLELLWIKELTGWRILTIAGAED